LCLPGLVAVPEDDGSRCQDRVVDSAADGRGPAATDRRLPHGRGPCGGAPKHLRPDPGRPGERARCRSMRQPAHRRGARRTARRQTRTGRGELHRDADRRDPVMMDRPRVLVVDDELGPRESLRMILKPSYEIATAESGAAALQTIDGFHPDVVFMDIKMPQMDGIELLQRIKRMDPSIEVVMITAYASLDTVKNALTHGAFEYLIKPFSRKDLEDTARRALARRQTGLGTRSHVTQLVDEMRSLAKKADDLEEEARREQAEQLLRVTQLSILREISRGILRQLDFDELTATIIKQLRDALGYDEVGVHLGVTPPATVAARTSIVCPIVDAGLTLGYLIAANHSDSP